MPHPSFPPELDALIDLWVEAALRLSATPTEQGGADADQNDTTDEVSQP
jgi:hypothetical protein